VQNHQPKIEEAYDKDKEVSHLLIHITDQYSGNRSVFMPTATVNGCITRQLCARLPPVCIKLPSTSYSYNTTPRCCSYLSQPTRPVFGLA